MKKILLLTLLLFIPLSSFAEDGSCSIKDAPAPELLDYILNIRKIINNVRQEVNKSDSKKTDINRVKANITKIYNQATSWSWYWSTFEYYVELPLSSTEVPYQIKRDHDMIEKELEWLSNYLGKLIEKWVNETVVSNACDWVETISCDLDWKKAEDIMWELIKNVSSLWDSYRKSILWDSVNTDFKYTPDNFDSIWDKYNEDSLQNCSYSADWFWERIDKALDNISLNSKEWKKAIKIWEDAIALLLWKSNNFYEKEEEILKRELARQWVSWSQSEAMINNLRRYNETWYTWENNFITNTFKNLSENIWRQLSNFKRDIWDMMWDDNTQTEDNLKKSIKDLVDLWDKNDITLSIIERVWETYQRELPFAQMQDTNTEALQARIINMHSNLTKTINTLEQIIPISEKVCNDQDSWEWLCSTD